MWLYCDWFSEAWLWCSVSGVSWKVPLSHFITVSINRTHFHVSIAFCRFNMMRLSACSIAAGSIIFIYFMHCVSRPFCWPFLHVPPGGRPGVSHTAGPSSAPFLLSRGVPHVCKHSGLSLISYLISLDINTFLCLIAFKRTLIQSSKIGPPQQTIILFCFLEDKQNWCLWFVVAVKRK